MTMAADRPRAGPGAAALADAVRSWSGPRLPRLALPSLAQLPHLPRDVAEFTPPLFRRVGEVIHADAGAFQLVADLDEFEVGRLGSGHGGRDQTDGEH